MADADEKSLFDRLMAVMPAGMTRNAWATKAGLSRVVFNDIRKRGTANHSTIEKLLDTIGVSWAQFDAGIAPGQPAPTVGRDIGISQSVESPIRNFHGHDRPRDVPVMATAACATLDFSGDDGSMHIETLAIDTSDVVDYLRRPPSLAGKRDIYAIYFVGHSMEPRFEPGEPAYVDPTRAPKINDYVVVWLKAGKCEDDEHASAVLAKRLVRSTSEFVELEQFNPPLRFRVSRTDLRMMHRIIPWADLATV